MIGNNNENRNCNCGNNNNDMMNYDCNYTPEGINASFGYNTASESDNNTYNINNYGDPERESTREEMIQRIKE